MFDKNQLGRDFKWGVTISAFQNEGAAGVDDKGKSIWDTFTEDYENIKNADVIGDASAFYEKYEDDIILTKQLGFNVFRFSIGWSRILPDGIGQINPKGIDFYNKVINCCIENGLTPWITLYHWDLPQKLEDEGGWTNRSSIQWFTNYVEICVRHFKDRVTNWVVMNEPMTFVGLGYFMGYHAPQKNGVLNFLKAAHHVTLSMAEGGRVIRKLQAKANIGVALSCSLVKPINKLYKNKKAAKRMEAMLNRFFIEPLLGMGYPMDVMPSLAFIKTIFQKGDEERMKFDFDYIGLQYYFRVVAKHSLTPIVLFADEVSPLERKSNLNTMNLDYHPKGMYKLLSLYHKRYPMIKSIIITESGVCLPDHHIDNEVHDSDRKNYHKKMIKQVLKAKKDDIPVNGYFVWTLIDNFEWKEGFEPRFGLVYNDFESQKRTIKESGLWFQKFLKKAPDPFRGFNYKR